MSDHTGLPSQIVRWITPSSELVKKLVGYREQRRNPQLGRSSHNDLPTTSKHVGSVEGKQNISVPSQNVDGNYVGILRSSIADITKVENVHKKIFRFLKTKGLPSMLRGLRIDLDRIERDQVTVCVYFLCESLANDLKIVQKRRYRKRKGPTSALPSEVDEPIVEDESEDIPNLGSSEEVSRIDDFIASVPSWKPFDPKYVLCTAKIKYRKGILCKLSITHIFTRIQRLPAQDQKVKALWKSMLRSDVTDMEIPDRDILIGWSTSPVLNQILLKVVRFHSNMKQVFSVFNGCLTHWVSLERKKKNEIQWRKSVKGLGNNTFDVDDPGDDGSDEDIVLVSIKRRQKRKRSSYGRLEENSGQQIREVIAKNAIRPEVAAIPQIDEYTQGTPKFQKLEDNVSHHCLIALISQMLAKAGFKDILCSTKNFRYFLRFIRQAICFGGAHSSLSVGQLMSGLNSEDCSWLKGFTSPIVRLHLLAKVVTWIFMEYIIPMVGSLFYVTETSSSRNQLEFYARKKWADVTRAWERHLVSTGKMVPISEMTNVQVNAKLRYVPKNNGTLRLILSYIPNHKRSVIPTNESGRLLLRYMSDKIAPHALFAAADFKREWEKFLYSWKSSDCPTLYFLRSDIKEAYPSVSVPLLVRILHEFPLPPDLQGICGGGQNCQEFRHYKASLNVSRKRVPKNNFDYGLAMKAVEAFVTPAVARLGKHRTYNLNIGLPQGGQLSLLLCNIYYGHMDKEHFGEFLMTEGELFIRQVDDYIFVSPNPQRVIDLWRKMKAGIGAFNCSFSNKKFRSNVREIVGPIELNNHSTVTFCGWNFDVTTGHVTRDFHAYAGLDTCATLSFVLSRKSGHVTSEAFIKKRLAAIAPLRLVSLVLCPRFNCRVTILRNIFQACLMLAFRFCAMDRVLRPDWSVGALKAINAAALVLVRNVLKIIESSEDTGVAGNLLYSCNFATSGKCEMIHTKISEATHVHVGVVKHATISRNEILFVLYHAFVLKMSKERPSLKKRILPGLIKKKKKLSRILSKLKQKELIGIIGNEMPTEFVQIKR